MTRGDKKFVVDVARYTISLVITYIASSDRVMAWRDAEGFVRREFERMANE